MSSETIDKVSNYCNLSLMDRKRYEESAKMLRALGHPMRLAMVEALRKRSWCVCELAAILGLGKSAASKHLSSLRQVGVIRMERQGTQVICTLAMPCVVDMMACSIDRQGRSSEEIQDCCSVEKEISMVSRQRIMFVCIHNSARSQMCEAFVRHFAADRFEVHSSGIESGKLNPLVVQAMAEIGLSMEGHHAKRAQEYIDRKEEFDYVVTVCDESSAERCPMFPGKHQRLHWGFPDPSAIQGTDEEKLVGIRVIRDAIKTKVESWLDQT